jgi:hypothetical protein
MNVEDWVSVPTPVSSGLCITATDSTWGATLNVGTLNDNPPGIYTGTYEISFDFN